MRFYQYAILILLTVSCSPEKKKDEWTIQPPASAMAQLDSTSSDPIPANANQELFEDTPGLVRAIVNEGLSLSQQGNYLNGKREGIWCEFHHNGLVKSATSYVNGVKEGLHLEINASGQLTKRIFFHNNLRHGEYKEFLYSKVKEERTYKNDKLEGLVKIFYDAGTLMEDGMYKNGLRDGISKWYDQQGNVTITYEYRNGELVKK
jgi:MORN repeat variant